MRRAPAAAGFTLVETLIALSVFALIALGGVALLNITVSSQERLDAASDQTRELQRLQAVLRADIGQMVERTSRAQNGSFEAPLQDGGANTLLQFASLGRLEDPEAPKPVLQKVRYWVEGGALYRAVFAHADGAVMPRAMAVLKNVSGAQVAVFSNGRWAAFQAGAGPALPLAVELRIDHQTLGTIKLRFLTPGQGGQQLTEPEALF